MFPSKRDMFLYLFKGFDIACPNFCMSKVSNYELEAHCFMQVVITWYSF